MAVEFVRHLLDVDTILCTVLGHQLSVVEFVGTILYLWSVWLIAKRNILTWPVGIASVLLYFVMFYQINLYSDMFEQVYYVVASVYGWYYWAEQGTPEENQPVNVRLSSTSTILIWVGVTGLLSVVAGYLMSRIDTYFPGIFQHPASYPYIDAVTTMMSFVAMFLMAQKRLESWIYWIVVDVVGIWLYFVKGVQFVSLLYVILLGLAIKGLYEWVSNERRRAANAT